MKKSTNTKSNARQGKAKRPTFLGEYNSMKMGRRMPVTQAFLDLLAEQLIEYANKDNSISMGEFYRQTGILKSTFLQFVEQSPRLSDAYVHALEIMGFRRDDGTVMKKYDSYAVWKMQYRYGSDWREAGEYHAALAKKDQSSERDVNINVNMSEVRSDDKYFKKDS